MVAANCLLGAGALAGLGVHFDCQGLAGWNVLSLPCLLLGMGEMHTSNGAESRDALRAADIAADVV
jgi:hypothetical protein